MNPWVLSLILLNSSVSLAAEPITLRFEDLPSLVHSRNEDVTGSKRLTEAAEARTGYLVRSYLPNISAFAGAEHFQTGPYSPMSQPYWGTEARMNLFRGGRDGLEDQIRTRQAHATAADAQRIYRSQLAEARKLYWQIASNFELISILRSASEQNEKQLEAANRRIARGLSSETDRLEFQIYRSQLHDDIESLEQETQLLQISLSATLGMDAETRFKTQESIPHVHDEALLDTSIDPNSNPEVAILRASQERSSLQKSLSNRWWTPSLDVYAGAFLFTLRDREYLSQRNRHEYLAGFRLSIDLFDGLQSKANASAFGLEANGLELQAQQRARNLEAQVSVARKDLKNAHVLIHQSEERIQQGKSYLSRTLDEYNRGVKNSIDALAAAQRYVGFQRQYAERRRNYQITKSNLLALLGQ